MYAKLRNKQKVQEIKDSNQISQADRLRNSKIYEENRNDDQTNRRKIGYDLKVTLAKILRNYIQTNTKLLSAEI